MGKFKVGDKVQRTHYSHDEKFMTKDSIHIVDEISGMGVRVKGYDKYYCEWYFTLVSPPLTVEEEAIKLLAEKGYTITPPPEFLKGRAVIYKNSAGKIFCTPEETWELWGTHSRSLSWRSCRTIIAIVDWTEGQGI